MRAEKVIKYIVDLLKEKLPSGLVYHIAEHTEDVVNSAIRLSKLEGLSQKEQDIVMVSAALHDAGYLVKYTDNEELAAEFAINILPEYGYTREEIAMVMSCIIATKIPQMPSNHLAEIVCDADLDYLGRNDFFYISDKLRKEWINFGLIGNDEKEWNRIQFDFLTSHKYFTKSASNLRNDLKLKHLNEIRTKI